MFQKNGFFLCLGVAFGLGLYGLGWYHGRKSVHKNQEGILAAGFTRAIRAQAVRQVPLLAKAAAEAAWRWLNGDAEIDPAFRDAAARTIGEELFRDLGESVEAVQAAGMSAPVMRSGWQA